MKRTLFYLTVFVFAFTGCSEFEEPERIAETDEVVASATATPQTRAGAANVFEQMANPYSLALMRQLKNNPSLQPTHLYVRFLPADSAQLNKLEDNLDLDLFDYPLDVNIEDDEIYVDPTIPEGEFTWQYTAVPANFTFPTGIQKEILQQCYIPADNEEAPPATRAGGESNLERLAILACGYELLPGTRASGSPSGVVQVMDDSDGTNEPVPVKGVRVKCHYFLKTGKAYTDANGNYSISKTFHVKPHYTVVFKNRKDFILWSGPGDRAKIKITDRQSPSGYNIVIPRPSTIITPPAGLEDLVDLPWTLAAVNNAAYDYYTMCEATGIAKPPKGLRIWVSQSMGNSAPMMRRLSVAQPLTKANWFTFLGLGAELSAPATITDALFKFLEPDVTINGEASSYRSLYESTNHELSHASHFTKVGSNYWAKYISYIVQHNGYGSGQGSYNGICEVGEMWGDAMGHIQEHEQFERERLMRQFRVGIGNFTLLADWIRPDPIWALITRGVLSKKQIFDCLTSDVDTVDKLINKLCLNKTAEVANAIRTAFAHNDVPVITGTVPSQLNVNATLSVPTVNNLSNAFTFNGWTVSPNSGYTTTSGLNNRNLTIKFTAAGTYTLTANFTLPNGTTYSPTKTIDLRPPTITSVSVFPNITQAAPGQMISFVAHGTNLENATIQWEAVSGCDGASSGQGGAFSVYAQHGARAAIVRCRVAYGGGSYSAWKTASVTINNNLPWVRSADIP